MIITLAIVGIICLFGGAWFAWLNNNTPVQTFIPAILLPMGIIAMLLAIGGWLL